MEEIVGGCGSGCPARLGFPSTNAVSSRHKIGIIGIIGIIGRQSLARREKKGELNFFVVAIFGSTAERKEGVN